jgi:putative phosphoesterase
VRVAALYDIHGNLPALEAVLAEVARENVDAVVCGGDVVAGPFPVAVFDRLASLPDVRFVRGNADRIVVEGDQEYGHDWSADRRLLGDARVAAIASWPLSVEVTIAGLGRALFCHAVPTADDPIYTRITPDQEVVELIGDVAADVVVSGHTHVQVDRRLPSGLRVVNAGSVGMPYEGQPGAYWALLGPEVVHMRTEYDVEAAAALIRTSGYQGAESTAESLVVPPSADEATTFFENQRKSEQKAERGA